MVIGQTPQGICLAIPAHFSVEERGLHHCDEAARRWCKFSWFRLFNELIIILFQNSVRHTAQV